MNKKFFYRIIAVAALVFGISSLSVAGVISGSAHDFSTDDWSGGRICIACHAPHHTDTTVNDAPLWNHEVTAQAYTLYSSATLDATIGQPGGLSKLCLSCHDGTVAIDSFGGNAGATFVSGDSNLGSTLNDDHPIGFTYDAALASADGSLHPVNTAVTVGSAGQTKSGTIQSVLLFNDQMECSSCHDVHNTFTASGPGDEENLVRITQAGSNLCLSCHNK